MVDESELSQSGHEDADKQPPAKKQAVVLIHGIGEQIPMSTLRGFVDAVWSSDASLIPRCRPDGDNGQPLRVSNPVWTKPDKRNNSFELRRITTERMGGSCICGKCEGHPKATDNTADNANDRRTDFYEFYWADVMQDTTWSQTAKWLWQLMVRSPARVPKDVRPIWMFFWVLVIGVALAIYWIRWADLNWLQAGGAATALLATLGGTIKGILTSYAGDVARYTQADPHNVARRQEIRQKGISLLERLMGVTPEAISQNRKKIKAAERAALQSGSSPDEIKAFTPKWDTEYDRVVVVGHSLGAIIAYDLLAHSFARVNTALFGSERPQPKRAELEKYCQKGIDDPDAYSLAGYRERQRACFDELQDHGHPWLVSDFVTVGSPLTHADFLLADGWGDSMRQMSERRLPTCPPRLEWDRNLATSDADENVGDSLDLENFYFSFRPFDRDTATQEAIEREAELTANDCHARLPHHAAHFAFSRWTNIFSPTRDVLWGDLVSGKVADFFGQRRPEDRKPLTDDELLKDDVDESPLHVLFAKLVWKILKRLPVLAIALPFALIVLPLFAWLHALAERFGFASIARAFDDFDQWVRSLLPESPQPSADEILADLVGIEDIQVMPEDTEARLSTQGGIFPHTRYWDHRSGKYRIEDTSKVPEKIRLLRQALNLRFNREPLANLPEAGQSPQDQGKSD